jgi:hypothetical protein
MILILAIQDWRCSLAAEAQPVVQDLELWAEWLEDFWAAEAFGNTEVRQTMLDYSPPSASAVIQRWQPGHSWTSQF